MEKNLTVSTILEPACAVTNGLGLNDPISRRKFIKRTGGTAAAGYIVMHGFRMNAWADTSSRTKVDIYEYRFRASAEPVVSHDHKSVGIFAVTNGGKTVTWAFTEDPGFPGYTAAEVYWTATVSTDVADSNWAGTSYGTWSTSVLSETYFPAIVPLDPSFQTIQATKMLTTSIDSATGVVTTVVNDLGHGPSATTSPSRGGVTAAADSNGAHAAMGYSCTETGITIGPGGIDSSTLSESCYVDLVLNIKKQKRKTGWRWSDETEVHTDIQGTWIDID